MKSVAWILLVILAFLLLQPLVYGYGATGFNPSCDRTEPVKSQSCQSKCSKPKPSEDKDNCEGNRCNPLLGCPTGNFYVHNYTYISITPVITPKQQTTLVNDNRIAKQLTECWHPPEII